MSLPRRFAPRGDGRRQAERIMGSGLEL